ncbi:MAG: DUF711 family protein [Conexivisphaera sp.]
MRIRALALLGEPPSWDASALRDTMERWTSELAERARSVSSSGIEVWTLRISLPGLPGDDPSIVERVASAAPEGALVSIGHTRRPEVLEAAASRGLYAYMPISAPEDAAAAAAAVYRVARGNPEDATRVAVSAGGHLLSTPYFPISSALPGRILFAASLLYPSDVDPSSPSRSVRSIFRAAERAAPWASFDYSLSPWMEESVAALIERAYGVAVGSPGSLHAVRELNRIIRSSAGPSAIGFNEVMLPVEEDSVLKRMAREGSLRASDLLRLASVCVAGVDMAVVSAGPEGLRRFLLDARAVSASAGKPIGVRLIPVDEPPGTPIDLGRFGTATAIGIRCRWTIRDPGAATEKLISGTLLTRACAALPTRRSRSTRSSWPSEQPRGSCRSCAPHSRRPRPTGPRWTSWGSWAASRSSGPPPSPTRSTLT